MILKGYVEGNETGLWCASFQPPGIEVHHEIMEKLLTGNEPLSNWGIKDNKLFHIDHMVEEIDFLPPLVGNKYKVDNAHPYWLEDISE